MSDHARTITSGRSTCELHNGSLQPARTRHLQNQPWFAFLVALAQEQGIPREWGETYCLDEGAILGGAIRDGDFVA